MNNVETTNRYIPYSSPSYPKGLMEGLSSSILSGYMHAALTTPPRIGSKTGLNFWAIPQALRNASVLCCFPIYKQIFDKYSNSESLSTSLAGGFSGLSQVVLDYKSLNLKGKYALAIQFPGSGSSLTKLASQAFEKFAFYSVFFTSSQYFASLLHEDGEGGLSSMAKNAAAGAAGGAVSHVVSRPVQNLRGFKVGFSHVFKNAVKIYPSVILGAAALASLDAVEELKTAVNKLIES